MRDEEPCAARSGSRRAEPVKLAAGALPLGRGPLRMISIVCALAAGASSARAGAWASRQTARSAANIDRFMGYPFCLWRALPCIERPDEVVVRLGLVAGHAPSQTLIALHCVVRVEPLKFPFAGRLRIPGS